MSSPCLWRQLDRFLCDDEIYSILTICHVEDVRLFLLPPATPTLPPKLLCSIPTRRVAYARVLPCTLSRDPLVFVSCDSVEKRQRFPSNTVQCFSFKNQAYIYTLRCYDEITRIEVNEQTLAVAMGRKIHVYHVQTHPEVHCQIMFSLSCGINESNIAPFALGSNWLAYIYQHASSSDLPTKETPVRKLSTDNDRPHTTIYDVSVNLASAVVSVGEQGKGLVKEFLLQEKYDIKDAELRANLSVTDLSDDTGKDMADTIVVQDGTTGKVLVCFDPQVGPISGLFFDPSGQLLLVVPRDAQYVHIFQVLGPSVVDGDTESDYRQSKVHYLYRIFRGVTHTQVQDVCFSNDSRYLCVTSRNGTVHLYCILRDGGMPNATTHMRGLGDRQEYNTASMYASQRLAPRQVHLTAVQRFRLHHNTQSSETVISSNVNTLFYECNPSTQFLVILSPQLVLKTFHVQCYACKSQPNTSTPAMPAMLNSVSNIISSVSSYFSPPSQQSLLENGGDEEGEEAVVLTDDEIIQNNKEQDLMPQACGNTSVKDIRVESVEVARSNLMLILKTSQLFSIEEARAADNLFISEIKKQVDEKTITSSWLQPLQAYRSANISLMSSPLVKLCSHVSSEQLDDDALNLIPIETKQETSSNPAIETAIQTRLIETEPRTPEDTQNTSKMQIIEEFY